MVGYIFAKYRWSPQAVDARGLPATKLDSTVCPRSPDYFIKIGQDFLDRQLQTRSDSTNIISLSFCLILFIRIMRTNYTTHRKIQNQKNYLMKPLIKLPFIEKKNFHIIYIHIFCEYL